MRGDPNHFNDPSTGNPAILVVHLDERAIRAILSSPQSCNLDQAIINKATPPKFNMEPENKSLEKESPFGNHDLQVPC